MASAQYTPPQSVGTEPAKATCAGWRELGERMIQAALHSVYIHPEESQALRAKLLEASEALKGEPDDETVRKHSAGIAAEVERHNQTTQKALDLAMTQLRETVEVLSQGLSSLADANELGADVETLQSVISAATSPEAFEAGRAKVAELVELIASKERERATRQAEFIQELQTRIQQMEAAKAKTGSELLTESKAQASTTDTLTGIPNGAACRDAVVNAQQADRPPIVAVMHIQCLDVLNARFGQRIGDQIVLTCCQHLASNLCRETDRIFRWRGPAFVALLDRDDSPAGVGREVAHVCNAIASSFFGEPHRSILIPVKMLSTTIPVEGRLITDVFDSVERFIVRSGRPNG